MIATDTETIIGVFDHEEEAATAIDALHKAGFSSDHIGVASREWSKHFNNISSDEQHTAASGAVWGSFVGGGLGAIVAG